MKSYKWTDKHGEEYEVKQMHGYYFLFRNECHTQLCVPDSTHFEEACSRLIKMYEDAQWAEYQFFKSHPELNP